MNEKHAILIADAMHRSRPFKPLNPVRSDPDVQPYIVWERSVQSLCRAITNDYADFDAKKFLLDCGMVYLW